ncbi:hypothetical protein [Bradyrhizobium diazoefficiens]|uniref:hypothetical protein n=1 Tax=Bradyrhizobium diazoefficiens TaxID=1355477 RepID=UPI00272AC402|nr:hypothetical protein [Bradyrhizobium diazoefficiens]WLA63790.1 hypothetical protein QNN01_36355 [Bradyrhizobium diazoefficiens]
MKAVAVFTNRGLNRILSEGGTQAWSLKPGNAKKFKYVVCTQNRDDGDWGAPTHAQGQGFLIGKLKDVLPSPEGRPDRYIITFDQYAEIDVPNMAYQWRNPVRYIELSDFGIDPDKLTWKPAQPYTYGEPLRAASLPDSTPPETLGLDIAEAKKALSVFYRVPVNNIEILIRG